MNSKEELSRQHEDTQKQIDEQKEKSLQLQQLKTEMQKAVETINQENKAIIEHKVPAAFNEAKVKFQPVENLNTEKKQDVLDYIQKLLTDLSEKKQHSEKLHENTKKRNELLEQVHEHLKKGYNKKTLTDLTNKSGIVSIKNTDNTGFALLLELLGEPPSKYTWTLDSTDRDNLLKVVPQKIEALAFTLAVDEQTKKEMASGLKALEQIQTKLVNNYDEHDKLSVEIVQLEEQISQIETVTVKELTAQAEDLERQIKELEQQEQEKRERERREEEKREQEKEQRERERREEEKREQEKEQRERERRELEKREQEKEQRERERREEEKREQEKEHRKQERREQKMKERGALAAELKKVLIEYIDGRKQHYSIKDVFLPGDKRAREQFIGQIVNAKDGLLKEYVDSGNIDKMLNTITAEISSFNGIKMQATLNRMVVKLIEAEAKPVEIENLPAKAKQVLSLFEGKKGKSLEYALKMKNIYTQIEGINAYANTLPEREKKVIKQLVTALKRDVDQFVCQNSKHFPSKESYQKFKLTIKARLHSHDDLMSGHTSWPDIIINLLLSVITLGKLICSKARTGRASLFFDKTEDQKEIEAPVDLALENLGTFLAG
ncbi:hypothetical protein DGG96_09700 [Legionella qingyii]|uniref:Uncharacterized protein n=1 Tax=Legionella qingyii TaxID=2184757 RepID=A0A317U206_9GAMM|nr:hypothetical protein [Legionella qingyii]PWY55781.1 hypothetical protein DGG96_09700 [Legionella qingyii]